MEYKKFKSSWLGLQASNRFMKIMCISLLSLDLITVIGWLNKDTKVILIPPNLSEKSEVSRNKASEGYKKAWGMYVASLLGNVTPENSDFVLESIKGMVTGEIRSLVSEQISQDLEAIKQEKVSSQFLVLRVSYEPETDKVFVTGRNIMIGAGVKSNPTEQTFEFKIDVKQYAPVITEMASYAGMPKILSVLDKEKNKAVAELERQKKLKQ